MNKPSHIAPRSLRGEAAGDACPLSSAAIYPCPECEGVGFYSTGEFHPDDARLERTWDCDNCNATGEVDYPTPEYRGQVMSMAEVEAQIARAFGCKGIVTEDEQGGRIAL